MRSRTPPPAGESGYSGPTGPTGVIESPFPGATGVVAAVGYVPTGEAIRLAAETAADIALAASAPPPPTTAQRLLALAPKATAVVLAGYVSVIAFYVLDSVWDIEPPGEVTTASTGLLAAVFAWLAPRSADGT